VDYSDLNDCCAKVDHRQSPDVNLSIVFGYRLVVWLCG